jgi:hypothetical protein
MTMVHPMSSDLVELKRVENINLLMICSEGLNTVMKAMNHKDKIVAMVRALDAYIAMVSHVAELWARRLLNRGNGELLELRHNETSDVPIGLRQLIYQLARERAQEGRLFPTGGSSSSLAPLTQTAQLAIPSALPTPSNTAPLPVLQFPPQTPSSIPFQPPPYQEASHPTLTQPPPTTTQQQPATGQPPPQPPTSPGQLPQQPNITQIFLGGSGDQHRGQGRGRGGGAPFQQYGQGRGRGQPFQPYQQLPQGVQIQPYQQPHADAGQNGYRARNKKKQDPGQWTGWG